MDTRSTFAKNVESFRKGKGWSISELARQSGVSRSSVGHYETGLRRPKIESVKKLADALGVAPAALDPFGVYEAGSEAIVAKESAGIRYSADVWDDFVRWVRDPSTSSKAKAAILSTAELAGFTSRRLCGALSALSTASSQEDEDDAEQRPAVA